MAIVNLPPAGSPVIFSFSTPPSVVAIENDNCHSLRRILFSADLSITIRERNHPFVLTRTLLLLGGRWVWHCILRFEPRRIVSNGPRSDPLCLGTNRCFLGPLEPVPRLSIFLPRVSQSETSASSCLEPAWLLLPSRDDVGSASTMESVKQV